VDNEKGGWGNIGIDDIVFSDQPRTPAVPVTEQFDSGTMGLALLNDERQAPNAPGIRRPKSARPPCPNGTSPDGLFSKSTAGSDAPPAKPFGQKLVGALTRQFTLAPGQSATVTFVVAGTSQTSSLGGLGDYEGRHYGKRFANALAVGGIRGR